MHTSILENSLRKGKEGRCSLVTKVMLKSKDSFKNYSRSYLEQMMVFRYSELFLIMSIMSLALNASHEYKTMVSLLFLDLISLMSGIMRVSHSSKIYLIVSN